jgi:polysaccharide biosynthesis transport protein
LKTQMDADQSNLHAEAQRRASLEAKLAEYEARLYQTPLVERDFKSLSRDYDNALKKYSELKNKQLEARMAQQLESGDNAEQFVLLSSAFLPSMPESPNRIGILLLGGLLALGSGVAFVAVAEYLDRTVRDANTLEEIFGAPPLAVIAQMRLTSASPRGAG